MLDIFYDKLQNLSMVATIIISVSCMLFFGFAVTRITKKLHLPNVTAYILAGILLGPHCLRLVPDSLVEGMDFLADIALAFIAFGTGEFFRFSALKRNGMRVVVITVAESLLASVSVFAAVFCLLHLDLSFCVVLAAMAAMTASASTVMTIRQTGAKGDFVDTLLQVVALDNVVGLIAYSIAISAALAARTGSFSAVAIAEPILTNLGVLLLGGLFGGLLKFLMPKKRTTDNRLIISVATLFAFCGICVLLDVSPLLGCMSMGMVYINITGDDKLFRQLNYFSPPILLLFFVRSGLSFRLDALVDTSASVGTVSLLAVGLVYFAVRLLGKYGGAFLGCLMARKKKEVRNYLGLALIPQAGVTIGLAALGARTLGGEMGNALQTVILASGILYELAGPACAKLSLYLSKSYSEESEAQQSEAESLARTMQEETPGHGHTQSEEERAFLEAAEEQYTMTQRDRSKPLPPPAQDR